MTALGAIAARGGFSERAWNDDLKDVSFSDISQRLRMNLKKIEFKIEEYKILEYDIVWNPYDVVRRIETGEYPFPYQELIHKKRIYSKRKIGYSQIKNSR
jgi:hypothetical protein